MTCTVFVTIIFDSSLGTAVFEDLIRASLSIVDVLSQHHALISPYHDDVSISSRNAAPWYCIEWMFECCRFDWLPVCMSDWLPAHSLVHQYRTGILWYSTNVSTFRLTGLGRQPVIILVFCYFSATVRFSASIPPSRNYTPFFSHLEKNTIRKFLYWDRKLAESKWGVKHCLVCVKVSQWICRAFVNNMNWPVVLCSVCVFQSAKPVC